LPSTIYASQGQPLHAVTPGNSPNREDNTRGKISFRTNPVFFETNDEVLT
jgi:hypothetical protein